MWARELYLSCLDQETRCLQVAWACLVRAGKETELSTDNVELNWEAVKPEKGQTVLDEAVKPQPLGWWQPSGIATAVLGLISLRRLLSRATECVREASGTW